MSRSIRHTPIISYHGYRSNKWFRHSENKAKRCRVKQQLHVGDYEDLPHDKEYGNEWDSPRDGKCWVGDMPYTKCYYCRHKAWWHHIGYSWRGNKTPCECSTRLQEYKEYLRK